MAEGGSELRQQLQFDMAVFHGAGVGFEAEAAGAGGDGHRGFEEFAVAGAAGCPPKRPNINIGETTHKINL